MDGLVRENWGSSDGFLDEVQRSGLFAELEGVGDGWKFLHRSIREFLAAKALQKWESEKEWLERAAKLDYATIARWSSRSVMRGPGYACMSLTSPTPRSTQPLAGLTKRE